MEPRLSQSKVLLFLLVIFLFSVSVISLLATSMRKNGTPLGLTTQDITSREVPQLRPVQPLKFFQKELFYKGVAWADIRPYSFPSPISGGIIPHHLLPSFMIADFFRQMTVQNPKTIILIGPNHYELGSYRVLSSLMGWRTPFGDVEPETSLIEDLVAGDLVRIDEIVAENEHSVAGIMPFIKYYMPNTRVVPLIVSGRMTLLEVKELVGKLTRSVGKEIAVVASVDFSHYLSCSVANVKDRETLEIIKNFDYRRLMALNNDYLDSPPAIAILLMVMQLVGKTTMQEVSHTNSGEIMGDSTVSTTSYFSLVFY